MKRLATSAALSFICIFTVAAQQTIIEGQVLNYINHEPLPYATIKVLEGSNGTVSDSAGYYKLQLPAGLYNLEASYTGFSTVIKHEIRTQSSKPVLVDFEMHSDKNALQVVEVTAEAFRNTSESPLALQRINLHELQRMPGATLDVSKFIKTLPGVSPKVSFGYNLIVRGGASNENKFYLDGIEIPSITHFTVQGTSGGPNGLLNVLMLENASLHSSAFPAYAGNALSSVMSFHQREGRKDRFGGSFSLGATDWGFLLEGPMGKKSSFLFSARESYTQHLLKAIGVPVIPFYADVQYKQVIHFNPKNELTLTGVAGYDKYTLNLGAEPTESLLYNTGYIPEGKQVVYAAGAVYKHYLENSFYTVVLSRNHFYNYAEKFIDNSLMEQDRLFDYTSKESENKLRIEHKLYRDKQEWNYGISMESDQVDIQEYSLTSRAANSIDEVNFHSMMDFVRYGAFGSFSQRLVEDKLSFYAGLRLDGNTYSDLMKNPLKQLSPRVSLSWQFKKAWQLSGNAGRYFQVPPYILMAFSENNDFTNRDELKYMRSDHLGLGMEHTTSNGYRLKLEGFYKKYKDYPFLKTDSISYANANANFVLVGDQPADASSEGRAYGVEFQIKQKYRKSWSWSLAYSFVVSQFEDKNGKLASSSWDNRHFGTVVVGKTFGKNWQVGMKWSLAGGNPYTAYDQATSGLRSVWDVNYRGIQDYSNLNQEKLPAFHQLDIRIDKQFNFKRWSLSVFMDVQNAYASSVPVLPYLTVERNQDLTPIVDSSDPSRYKTKLIDSDTGRVLPSIGFVADF
jgi:outer membrane receptor protein involved in Fe transport